MITHQSDADMSAMVGWNMLKKCPVSTPDIACVKRVYGPNIAGVQGKGVRRSPHPVVGDYVDVLPQIWELNNILDISADIIPAFFLISSQNVRFLMGESILSCLKI